MQRLLSDFKDIIRNALYSAGILGLWHQLRNRRSLTIFMFHRVLPEQSAEFEAADREYTFTQAGFSQCLRFIKRHYNVVGLRDLLNPGALPSCPALITFDDGWRDTLLHATPELVRLGLPGVVFVVPEAIHDPDDRWWADALVQTLKSRAELEKVTSILHSSVSASAHEVHAAFAAKPAEERWRTNLLKRTAPAGTRQMLREDELILLAKGGLQIGAHGWSHCPLTHSPNANLEMQRSHAWLTARASGPFSMAFPHGAESPALTELALAAGFAFAFSSVPHLNRIPKSGNWAAPLSRIHIPENRWTCDESGHISGAKLAAFLFFRKAS